MKKKHLFFSLLAATAVVALASCGNEDTTSATTQTTQQTTTGTVFKDHIVLENIVKEFNIGDSITSSDFDLTLATAEGQLNVSTKDITITVKDSKGNTVEEFTDFGKYTVEVGYKSLKAEAYEVTVTDNVSNAIALANLNKEKVVSGSLVYEQTMYDYNQTDPAERERTINTSTDYVVGKNYSKTIDHSRDYYGVVYDNEYYYTVDSDDEAFALATEGRYNLEKTSQTDGVKGTYQIKYNGLDMTFEVGDEKITVSYEDWGSPVTEELNYKITDGKLECDPIMGYMQLNYDGQFYFASTVSNYTSNATVNNSKGFAFDPIKYSGIKYYSVEEAILAIYKEGQKDATKSFFKEEKKDSKYTFTAAMPAQVGEDEVLYVFDVEFTLKNGVITTAKIHGDDFAYDIVVPEGAEYDVHVPRFDIKDGKYTLKEGAVKDAEVTYKFTQVEGERKDGTINPSDYYATEFDLSINSETYQDKATVEVKLGDYVTPNFTNIKVNGKDVADFNSLDNAWVIIDDGIPNIPMFANLGNLSVGEHTLVAYTSKVTKEYKINVVYQDVTEISAASVITTNTFSEVNAYGSSYSFSAKTGYNQDPGYYAELASEYEGVTLVKNEDGTYTINAASNGTYQVKITSSANADITATLDVTFADFNLSYGNYHSGTDNFSVDGLDFVIGADAVTVTSGDDVVTYTYAYDAGIITLTPTGEDTIGIEVKIIDGKLCVKDSSSINWYEMEEGSLADALASQLDNIYEATVGEYTFSLSFSEYGCYANDCMYYPDFTYSMSDPDWSGCRDLYITFSGDSNLVINEAYYDPATDTITIVEGSIGGVEISFVNLEVQSGWWF